MNEYDIHPAYHSIEAVGETPKEAYLREQREEREAHQDMVATEQAFRAAYQKSLFRKRRV